MTPERYEEIHTSLTVGIEVELPRDEWREFYAMVPLPPKRKAEVRHDNHVAGHAYAYCQIHGEQVGVKYGYGVWGSTEADACAAYDVALHNSMYHKEEE